MFINELKCKVLNCKHYHPDKWQGGRVCGYFLDVRFAYCNFWEKVDKFTLFVARKNWWKQ